MKHKISLVNQNYYSNFKEKKMINNALTNDDLDKLKVNEAIVETAMDPRLQLASLKIKQGIQKNASVSTDANHIAVIAKVTNLEEWEALSEVSPGAVLCSTKAGESLVTARIPISRIEFVRQKDFVVSLKAAQRIKRELDETISETGARSDLLPNGNQTNGGEGVIIGIVDFGCDFAHENFLDDNGMSRILSIWDQNAPSTPNSPFGYGEVYTKDDIDNALQSNNPYSELDYNLDNDIRGTHGTHVMDIAAGNGRGSGVPGVSPKADIVFVELSSSDIDWVGEGVVGQSFGDSVQLLEAIKFIFDQAGDRPCVVNLSLGTNGGPHDGTTLVEEAMDEMLEQQDNRAIVIAASNSFADGIHANGNVTNNNSVDISWTIPLQNLTHNEIEIWFDSDDRFVVELLDPQGNSIMQVAPNDTKFIDINGQIVLLASNRLNDPNNGDNMIGIFLERGLPPGNWTIRLTGQHIANGEFHAWIERDDASPSSFAPPHDNSHTIGSISCGKNTIVVGSYDAHKNNLPLSWFSSAGPTRDARQKPEVSAPGHAVWAAKSRTFDKVVSKSGTSMAAPAVAGIISLAFAEALAQNKSLSISDLRNLIITTARSNPPVSGNWDPRYGHGRVSASDIISNI